MSLLSVHALTKCPTPVFNTPEIRLCFGGESGDALPLDEHGLMRSVETVLFPNTPVQCIKEHSSLIWEIKTSAYDYPNLFIDKRFVAPEIPNLLSGRKAALPSADQILKTLRGLKGSRYMWGGNWPSGISLLSELYPSKTDFNQLHPLTKDTWQLKGFDCSGLLHYATDGWTPRNTSALIRFGKGVEIEGKETNSIVEQLKPLDLIVWKGHVVCVLDPKTTIESKLPEGVVELESSERLSQIVAERKPVNEWDDSPELKFVIRRWYTPN